MQLQWHFLYRRRLGFEPREQEQGPIRAPAVCVVLLLALAVKGNRDRRSIFGVDGHPFSSFAPPWTPAYIDDL